MRRLSLLLILRGLYVLKTNAQLLFVINAPNNLIQCQEADITWTGGMAPYFFEICPGGMSQAPALQQYANVAGQSFRWSANISAGTSVAFRVTDSSSLVTQSASSTISLGFGVTSCLDQAAEPAGPKSSSSVRTTLTSAVSVPSQDSYSSTIYGPATTIIHSAIVGIGIGGLVLLLSLVAVAALIIRRCRRQPRATNILVDVASDLGQAPVARDTNAQRRGYSKFSNHVGATPARRVQEADSGVRLAGGRSSSGGSEELSAHWTLPPPYSMY
ncbi:hypothetical protein BV20DRAFT_87481 [Pilatotrama ljubarskyi]|nr:hypothetical protein BV20DRAFT_87481 [Pilatotrama ljubarskyi]